MRKALINRIYAVLLTAAVSLAVLSGCASGPAGADAADPQEASLSEADFLEAPSAAEPVPVAEPVPAATTVPAAEQLYPAAAQSTPAAAQSTPAAEQAAEEQYKNVIHVSSVGDLLDAISPGAVIQLEPGYYNLSSYLFENYRDPGEYDIWNGRHRYVRLQKVYDGLEFMVKGVSGLTILGGTADAADTEIVVDPRYAAVMNFEDCSELTLRGLTMGHTDTGDCSGNVLNFTNCRNVELKALDLYGCGVYGIGAEQAIEGFRMANSVIRDCAFGPMDIYQCAGDMEFTDCFFTGSDNGGYFEDNGHLRLAFHSCYFGRQESNAWYFRKLVQFDNCKFVTPEEHPDDWRPEKPVFEPEKMRPIPFDEAVVGNTVWDGYAVVDPQTGEPELIGENTKGGSKEPATLIIFDDGIGVLELEGNRAELDWSCPDPDHALLEWEGQMLTAALYEYHPRGDFYYYWILLEYDNQQIWFSNT